MQDAARYQAAIEVLDDWLSGTAAEAALTRWARGARYGGSGDRAAVRDIVYTALRRRDSAAAAGGALSGRGLVLGLLRLSGRDPGEIFTGDRHAPAPLEPILTDLASSDPDPEADIPAWLRPDLRAEIDRRHGAGSAARVCAAMAERAPLFLRVARRRATPEVAIARLSADGITAVPDPRAPQALEVTGGARRLRTSAAYADGLVEPQDLSVQLACAWLGDVAGCRVLDYCAGGGGKALALADAGAEVTAHDADPRRMADLPERARRARVTIPQLATGDLPEAGAFDIVLTDVPCSGSGTWRRDPEAKWRLTPARLAGLTETQDAILDAAAECVAPGGRLVYMTCSLLPAENDARVAALCNRRPDFQQGPVAHWDPVDASDGFFAAVLTRGT